MAPVLFFLAGLPAAWALERVIAVLGNPKDADDLEGEAGATALTVEQLPWQMGAWPARVRLGVAATLPFLMAVAAVRFGAPQTVAVSLLVAALLACTGTDLLRYRVPDVITYPGTALALLGAALMPGGDFVSAVIAIVVSGGIFLLMFAVTRGGLGLGDVKLAVLIGAGLGFPAAYEAIVLGVIVGGLAILALYLTGVVSRKQAVPYAPCLALTAVFVALAQGASFAPL